MKEYLIGSLLKEYRTRLNISQEELCFGLCAVSTLSRIENGTQEPRRKLVEALFSKLGMSLPTMGLPMKESDIRRGNLEYKIINLVADGNLDIVDLLEEYKNCNADMEKLEQQFYLFYKALAEDVHRHDGGAAIPQYVAALRLTLENYELGWLPTERLLTRTELVILNNIARTQYFIGEEQEAIRLMEFLRAYFENKELGEDEKASNYPIILFNLENWYGKRNDAEKCLETCEVGIAACKQYRKYGSLPFHIFNQGYALALLERKTEAEEAISDAFVFFKRMDFHDKMEYAAKAVNEKFGFNFPVS